MKAYTSLTTKYMAVAATYCALRKVIGLRDAHVQTAVYNGSEFKSKEVPLLISEKAFVVVGSLVTSPWFFPITVAKDITWLEVKMRNLPPEDYGLGEKNVSHWVSGHILK